MKILIHDEFIIINNDSGSSKRKKLTCVINTSVSLSSVEMRAFTVGVIVRFFQVDIVIIVWIMFCNEDIYGERVVI